MAQQIIDIGVNADDGTGDSLFQAGQKINDNFTELYELASVSADIKFFGNEIQARLSNADINVVPSGTGVVRFGSCIFFHDNNIYASRTNEDLKITANGSGRVVIAGLGFGGTTITGIDSSAVNINDCLLYTSPSPRDIR